MEPETWGVFWNNNLARLEDRSRWNKPFHRNIAAGFGEFSTLPFLVTETTGKMGYWKDFYLGSQGSPHDTEPTHNPWALNYARPSSFTINSTLGYIFWSSLLNWQVLYIAQLFSRDNERVRQAVGVSGYFVLNNLLHSLFVILFVHSCFRWAEGILLLNFVNLSVLRFRHRALPLQVHLPAISLPQSWTFFALYWNGFMMVRDQPLIASRVAGGIFIWALLGYGILSLGAFKDAALSICLSIISVAIGIGQIERLGSMPEVVSPFIIGALLVLATSIQLCGTWPDCRWAGRSVRTRSTVDHKDHQFN
ncbi:hypothetical protein Purlil1_13999 [Purpureocillium lilacinum]|uniref:Uncharacterized protein n=1 Tax=Purpureocillium lilacinum TaxID=33203 RepID=A0ABR0BCI3_PURLI|nr:hypothetical protein Purlil1_13999 [Purpureocillium lilacinum]